MRSSPDRGGFVTDASGNGFVSSRGRAFVIRKGGNAPGEYGFVVRLQGAQGGNVPVWGPDEFSFADHFDGLRIEGATPNATYIAYVIDSERERVRVNDEAQTRVRSNVVAADTQIQTATPDANTVASWTIGPNTEGFFVALYGTARNLTFWVKTLSGHWRVWQSVIAAQFPSVIWFGTDFYAGDVYVQADGAAARMEVDAQLRF